MERPSHYVLGDDAHTPRPVPLMEWARALRSMDTPAEGPQPGAGWARVAHDQINEGVYISTVFLGLDHQFGAGPPLLFESMSFGVPDAQQEQERYSTWAEAEAGHAAMVERVKVALRGGGA